jgi:hypothetical protein
VVKSDRLRQTVVLFSCCLTVAMVLFFLLDPAAGAAKESGPRLSLSSTELDFGQVREGKIVSYDFKVRNTGKAELQIIEVRPG